MRSIYLEHDISDPASSLGYVLTPVAKDALSRVLASFDTGSTQRAWRISGDYGSGKTAWALALARIVKGQTSELPEELHLFSRQLKIQPVVATGCNEPLGHTILKALGHETQDILSNYNSSQDVVAAVREAINNAKADGFTGLLLLLDELGKNLEYAAQHPEHDDVFLLQRLAEESARSKENTFVIVAMLHQGISAYTIGLDSTAKREWSKVAGRFEEIVFAQPLEQITTLVAATLDVDINNLPSELLELSKHNMKAALRAGIYGSSAPESLAKLGANIFPLHPTVLPPLVRTMRRFGQNERSLFSFLSSAEPMGLQDHCTKSFNISGYYRIHHLFEYVRINLLPNITIGTSHTHWGIIDAVLSTVHFDTVEEESVLKTIAMLSLLDTPDLPSTEEIICLAVGSENSDLVESAIKSLKKRGVIYERGAVKGYCLWPNTSLDLEDLYDNAVRLTTQSDDDITALCKQIQVDYLVPRAYYTRTGTLRYAEVKFITYNELLKLIDDQPLLSGKGADLNIRVVLPADKIQERNAKQILEDNQPQLAQGVILAVAEPPCSAVAAMKDLIAWEWVKKNTPQLSGDRYAREEVARQIYQAEKIFRARLCGLDNLAVSGQSRMKWFCCSGTKQLSPGRELLAFLGKECERIYYSTPRVLNELINRRSPSGSAAAARSKLVEAMFMSSNKANLGMDDTKRPAEMALYLSIIKSGGFHVESEKGWYFRTPDNDQDNCKLVPALDHITYTLKNYGVDALVPIQVVLDALSQPPFGIREGLQPFILAIYLAVNHQRVAFYEDGTYLDGVGGDVLMRLLKEPQYYHLQYCALDGVRSEIFQKLLELMVISPKGVGRADVIDLVKPLVLFITKEVPEYSRKTNSISSVAASIRRALLGAREPIKLIFNTLPEACGLPPVDENGLESPDEFASRLRTAMHEIRNSYPKLIERLGVAICSAFDISSDFAQARAIINSRASSLSTNLADLTLRSFTLRLADTSLEDRAWIESVANLLAKKSPERWTDNDEIEFNFQLQTMAGRFIRTELALDKNSAGDNTCRIYLSQSDGVEVSELVNWNGVDNGLLRAVENEFNNIISKYGRNGLAAAMHAIWKHIATASGASSHNESK